MDNVTVQNIIALVKQSRHRLAVTINSELTLLYWQIGNYIKEDLLNNNRAEYGKRVIEDLSKNLTQEFGKGWGIRHLWSCNKIAEIFPDESIMHTLCAQLTWSHFKILCSIDQQIKRDFYVLMACSEHWSVRQLDAKLDTMFYERTVIASQPDDIIKQEISNLQNKKNISPDLFFKNTYVLDFLGLSTQYSESDLEDAIISNIQSFIMEMGSGFAFLERQKRISVDGTDYYLDLLFYHRKLKSLIAIDLKLGKFKPQYKGQMELYLRWLEKYELQPDENPPIGLLLCSEGNTEHIELLMLNQNDIRVAQYLTELPPKEWFIEKLHLSIEIAQNNNRTERREDRL